MTMRLTYSDLAELTLTRLTGERVAPPPQGTSETTFTINARLEPDGLGIDVSVDAVVHASGSQEQAFYRGSIQYHANFYGPIDSSQHPDVIELMWPYLRLGLSEQAGRLGFVVAVPLDCPRPPLDESHPDDLAH